MNSSGLRLGRVALWRQDENRAITWLVLPLTSSEAADLVALAGFLSPDAHADRPLEPARAAHEVGGGPPVWGPACPEPALRAWGQQFLNRLQGDQDTRVYTVHPGGR